MDCGSDVSVVEKDSTQAAEVEEGGRVMMMTQLTLDEWKAQQTDRRPTTTWNVRKPGEGCTSDPSWNKMHVLKKKHTDEEEDAGCHDNDGQFDDAVSGTALLCNTSRR